MNIFLIGFMGSGKTTLGKQLAVAMGYRFVDQDSLIEENQGMSINEIFSVKGEDKFREIERYTISELVKLENIVVATGGGAPCFYDNAEVMKTKGISIYLKVPTQTLFNRLRSAQSQRPLIRNKTEIELLEFIEAKVAEREFYYLKSTLTIESGDIRSSDIQSAIADYIK